MDTGMPAPLMSRPLVATTTLLAPEERAGDNRRALQTAPSLPPELAGCPRPRDSITHAPVHAHADPWLDRDTDLHTPRGTHMDTLPQTAPAGGPGSQSQVPPGRLGSSCHLEGHSMTITIHLWPLPSADPQCVWVCVWV